MERDELLYYDFGEEMMGYFGQVSPTLDDEELRARLDPPDYYWLLLWYTIGLAENCGSWVDTFDSYQHLADDVIAAYEHFGFPRTAAIVRPGIVIGQRAEARDEWTESDRREADALDAGADFSYPALMAHLRNHREQYAVDIAELDQ